MKVRKCMTLLLLGGILAGCGQNAQNNAAAQNSGSSVTGNTAPTSQIENASDSQMSSNSAGTVSETQTGSTVEQDTANIENTANTDNAQTGTANQGNDALMPAYVRVWGPVLSVNENSITIDNRSENGYRGELTLQIDPENTKVLDGENAYPEELTEIEVDDAVFAYIGQTMTLSLPPQVTAEIVFCDIPDSLRVPEFVTVTQMEQQSDGVYLLTTDNGQQYLVPETCEILPYLTKNLVTIEDIQQGTTCMVWRDEMLSAQKIVLLAQ